MCIYDYNCYKSWCCYYLAPFHSVIKTLRCYINHPLKHILFYCFKLEHYSRDRKLVFSPLPSPAAARTDTGQSLVVLYSLTTCVSQRGLLGLSTSKTRVKLDDIFVRQLDNFLLDGAQPVIPPNLYMFINIIAWG